MEGKLDFIVDTAAGNHPFDPYLNSLKVHGIMALVAFPSEIKLSPASLNLGTFFQFCFKNLSCPSKWQLDIPIELTSK